MFSLHFIRGLTIHGFREVKIKMKLPFSRFVVSENSMLPEYKPGDHVLTFNLVAPKVGDVIVFNQAGTKYIKRINRFNENMIYVVGDNRQKSSDAMLIAQRDIVGKVIMKY